MIAGARLTAFVASTDLARSDHFYAGVLGLAERSRSGFGIVYDGPGTELRITLVPELAAATYTVIGWEVPDIEGTVRLLRERGVEFLRFPDLKQDENDLWLAPDGTRVGWFADPDGNTLSVHQP